MTPHVALMSSFVIGYILLVFAIAWYARRRSQQKRSIIANPYVYSLSIAVYCTSWTFYGSVGKAATTGIDFLTIYLGPTLVAFSWFFVLKRIIRISKVNNISSIADLISLRYGNSQLLGALVTIIAVVGIMPYIALQIKAVAVTFEMLSGITRIVTDGTVQHTSLKSTPALALTIVLIIFGIMFGARKRSTSEQHDGLIAAVAFESIVKLLSLLTVGIFVTWYLHDGFSNILSLFENRYPQLFDQLFTFDISAYGDVIPSSTMLFLSMGAILLLPRQFHVLVVENTDIRHISKAMWLFPTYMFVINLFIMPIALGGILLTGTNQGADYFVVSLPLLTNHPVIALIAFIGGLSAAAGMVMVESVALSSMLINNLFMPFVVRFMGKPWFSRLLLHLRQVAIAFVVILGYLYYQAVGDSFMLVNMGLISFLAAMQFLPSLLGGLYWHKGNRTGALIGMALGFIIWGYCLFLPSLFEPREAAPSFIQALLHHPILSPVALFGLSGMDMWSHALFWSMALNIGAYLICSLLFQQSEAEKEQVRKIIRRYESDDRQEKTLAKRLSKPVTIPQFISLMSKFIGQQEADLTMTAYLRERNISSNTTVPEFELPAMKRFVERTLAGSVGAAAAGAIMDSYLSDMGSRMESVYDIFSTVRDSLNQSRETLYVRFRASEIINRTLDLQTIMDELLQLLLKEFKLDAGLIQLRTPRNDRMLVQSYQGTDRTPITDTHWFHECSTLVHEVLISQRPIIKNDITALDNNREFKQTISSGFVACAHIPIFREGEATIGVLSVYSKRIVGLFTEEFVDLLNSLAGQLAQAIRLDAEMAATELERHEKEQAQLANARVKRDMEIAEQIQLSLLPDTPPQIPGIALAGRCYPATHVGGDYYDYFMHDDTHLDLVIADVSGHSVGAALIMAEVRTLLRLSSTNDLSPSAILTMLNRQLYDDLNRAELFITMFYARIEINSGQMTYANAGHNQPLLHHPNTDRCIQLDADGLILGVLPEVHYEEQQISLAPGDTLLMYTDGIPEAMDPDGTLFGMERLCKTVSSATALPPEQLADQLYQLVQEYRQGVPIQDDISLIAVSLADYHPEPGGA